MQASQARAQLLGVTGTHFVVDIVSVVVIRRVEISCGTQFDTGQVGARPDNRLKTILNKEATARVGVVHNASLDRQCIADALGNRCVDLGFVDGSVPGTVPQTDTPVRDIGAARKPEAEVDQVFTKIGSPVDVIGVVTD